MRLWRARRRFKFWAARPVSWQNVGGVTLLLGGGRVGRERLDTLGVRWGDGGGLPIRDSACTLSGEAGGVTVLGTLSGEAGGVTVLGTLSGEARGVTVLGTLSGEAGGVTVLGALSGAAGDTLELSIEGSKRTGVLVS